jgi:hypothetical protein
VLVGVLAWVVGRGLLKGPVESADPFPSWETIAPPDGGFSVRMPGQPRTEKKKEETQRGPVERIEFTLRASPFHYTVAYADFPGQLIQGRQVDKALDLARDGALSAVKGAKLREYRPVALAGHPGREMIIEVEDGGKEISLRARFYLVKQRLYQVMVAADTVDVKRPELDYYLDSFQLTKP